MSETNTTTPATTETSAAQAQAAAPQEQKTAPAKAQVKTKSGDLIQDIASEVEQMGKQKAQNRAVKLAEDMDRNAFELGGVLRVILKNGWFEGHTSFGEYTMNTFGFQERKARYLIEIYEYLTDQQIPWAKVQGLGWTKIKDIARFLTLENVDEWVEKASKLTVIELQKLLKESSGEEGKEKTAKASSDTTTFKVKLHNDQLEMVQSALAKCKAETNTEHDNVALERICAGYCGGTVSAAKLPDLGELMQAAGWEAVLNKFGELFPQVNLEVEVAEAAQA